MLWSFNSSIDTLQLIYLELEINFHDELAPNELSVTNELFINTWVERSNCIGNKDIKKSQLLILFMCWSLQWLLAEGKHKQTF